MPTSFHFLPFQNLTAALTIHAMLAMPLTEGLLTKSPPAALAAIGPGSIRKTCGDCCGIA